MKFASPRGAMLFIGFFAPLFIVAALRWLDHGFGIVEIAPVFFHMFGNLDGTDPSFIWSFFRYVLLAPAAEAFALVWLSRRFRAACIPALVLTYGFFAWFALKTYKIMAAIPANQGFFAKPTDFYEKNYVAPVAADIKFGTKRSVVILVLESMDDSYREPSLFGRNLIPRLSQMMDKGEHVENYTSVSGLNFTMGGLAGMLCGLPVNYIYNRGDWLGKVLPNATCAPEILKAQGYDTAYFAAGRASFGGIEYFMSGHGVEKILDGKHFRDKYGEKKLGPKSWGGVNDEKLFEFIKVELAQIKSQNRPYFAVVSTMDMHAPGFLSPSCVEAGGDKGDFRDVVSCVDTLTADFVDWLRGFDREAVILVLADHNTMRNSISSGLDRSPRRNLLNVMLNAPGKIPADRSALAIDFFPTIIRAAGGDVKGCRLGLGRSLFADCATGGGKTLLEQFGVDELVLKLTSPNALYNRFMGIDK
ncbi:MAG: LTA synthase family protein [Rickettsiales bacterium]|jgi:phosphoglycerol transferase|nr:LTA synthase family protein [Rickettsiales bacterium]